MYAEIIYETGDHSIGYYDSEDELRRALEEQHGRATRGEPRGPTGGPAERIAKVFLYDEHPAMHNEANMLSIDEVRELTKSIAVGDQVSAMELASVVRDAVEPMVSSGPHETNYKAEGKEFNWSAE